MVQRALWRLALPELTAALPQWRGGRLLWVLLLTLVMSGCAVRQPAMEPAAPPAEPMSAEQELAGSPALSLLASAHQARAAGNPGSAGRYLERALNINPDSSWLYKELADLRMAQGDARGAEGFALRALRLAPDHNGYRAELWELVATARERQGDRAGARQARDKAQQLRQPMA